MNVRKLLQTELWSKRTSWKIVVGIGIVYVLFQIGILTWREVEAKWLTAGERIAAKAALQEIDALQDAGPMSDQEFQVRAKQAEAKVKAADAAARTFRDQSIEMKLGAYLVGVLSERYKIRRQQLSPQGRPPSGMPDRGSDEKTNSVMNEWAHNYRSALHQELD